MDQAPRSDTPPQRPAPEPVMESPVFESASPRRATPDAEAKGAPSRPREERVVYGPGTAWGARWGIYRVGQTLYLPRAWRNGAVALMLLALAVATWFAARQPPHPDMFRAVGPWDLARTDWWAYPLERNAFKRMVVRGQLNAVFALPDGSHVWAVGQSGLVIHSADGGRTWQQQRPALPVSTGGSGAAAPRATTRADPTDPWLTWMPSAHAQALPPREAASSAPSLPPPTNLRIEPAQQQQPTRQQVQQQPPPANIIEPAPNAAAPATKAAPELGAKGGPEPKAAAEAVPSGKAEPAPAKDGGVVTPADKAAPPVSPRDQGAAKGADAQRNLRGPKQAAIAAPAASVAAPAASTPAAAASEPAIAAVPPRVGEATLNAVFFVSATTGWAVGDGGTILGTRDGGATWVAQTSGSAQPLHGVHFAADGLRGWAVGDAGSVLATRDGGGTWQAQPSRIDAPLRAVQFADDGRRGWAAGLGALLATSDGGATWTPQTVGGGGDQALWGLNVAANGTEAWVVGAFSVFHTADGGKTWTSQGDRATPVLTDVQFAADAKTGWAVGADGVAMSTRDGGQQWSRQITGTAASLRGVHFAASGRDGWAVGDAGTVLVTRDGGQTWQAQAAGLKSSLAAVRFAPGGRQGWAAGADGTLLATRDGGATWFAQSSGVSASLRRLHIAADARTAWVAGSGGTVLATRDGGTTWVPQATGFTTSLSDIRFAANGRDGWAVGLGGLVIATRDAGATWVRQDSSIRVGGGSTSPLESVHFADDGQRGWLFGNGGTVATTRDGGSTWQPQAGGSNIGLRRVHMAADSLRGWGVTSYGQIRATRDGGASWVAQASGTRSNLYDVSFAADAQTGWIVGDEGTLLATRDGGSTWAAQASGTRARLAGLDVAGDARMAWVVGDDAAIMRTIDAGATWQPSAPYRRYWAPWYFAVLAFGLLTLAGLAAFVEPAAKRAGAAADAVTPGGAATTLRSDQPVLDKAGDRLGYRTAVEALSSFVRNRATEPRVTIAITGEWGTGKSSIMRMLQSDLEQAGFRTAWFNAWHQQQEGRQLTALFNTIRTQAVPRWWGTQFIAALRVRSRLIWGRGWFYKAVAIASAAGCALLLGDLLADGPQTAWAHVKLNVAHHVLQQQRTVVTGASLARLDPMRKPLPAAQSASAPAVTAVLLPATAMLNAAALGGAAEPPVPDLCANEELRRNHKKAEPIRMAVYCALKRNYLWEQGGDGSQCGVDKPMEPEVARRCIFDSAADLIATLNTHDKDGVRALWPSEEQAIRAAAETIAPPPMFRWLESSLLGGLAGFIVILFTKGVSVYGLQVSAPLRALLALGEKEKDSGKEAAGTIERYRAEFGLLCQALDGRLVVFIDDLDRCTPATVNGVLEMTNYLADVGRCFIVLGAAIERVKLCINSPVDGKYHEAYATEYLRKLIHIELPVPLKRDELAALLRERSAASTQSLAARWKKPLRTAKVAAAVAGIVLAIGLVFQTGRALHERGDGNALRVLPRPVVEAVAALPAPGAAAPSVETRPVVQPKPTERDVGLSAPPSSRWPWPSFALGLALLGSGFAWRWMRRNREAVLIALGGALRPQDSDRFLKALRIWNPVIVQHDPTPRHVKRFYNRARLFASYEAEEARATGRVPADDAALVAMAALHHVEPSYLARLHKLVDDAERRGADERLALHNLPRELVLRIGDPPSEVAVADLAEQGNELAGQLLATWQEYLRSFDDHPSAAQIERFMNRVRGIHVR